MRSALEGLDLVVEAGRGAGRDAVAEVGEEAVQVSEEREREFDDVR